MPTEAKADSQSASQLLDLFLPGASPAVSRLKSDILRLNQPRNIRLIRSVLILGESGAGKSYIAKIIAMHRCWLEEDFGVSENRKLKKEEIRDQKEFYLKNRAKSILRDSGEPFHEVPLTTLEGGLAPSLLFGHKKGSFSGATADTLGIFGEKRIRDVLLDEIGYASIDMQRRLLQVVQSGDFYRIGETKVSNTSARLFFATNQDLEDLVAQKKFQEDLWWRLTDYVIKVPPLRERKEEIVAFATEMLSELNTTAGTGGPGGDLSFARADLEWAQQQDWRGNLRELNKTIRRWYMFGGERRLSEVWQEIEKYVPQPGSPPSPVMIDRAEVVSTLMGRLVSAREGKGQLKSPDGMMEDLFGSAVQEASAALGECLKQLKPSEDELRRMFKIDPGSVRSWRSRNR